MLSSHNSYTLNRGDPIPKFIRIEKLKKKLPKKFFKMPIALVDDHYVGLARFKGRNKLHNHDRDELIYVVDGLLNIKINNRKYTLNAGEAILIKKGEKHVSSSEEGTHILFFEAQDITINFLEE